MAVGLPAASNAQSNPNPPFAVPVAEIDRLLDVMLPADAHSPGASELGLAQDIAAMVHDHAQLTRLFTLGFQWLNQAAGAPFAELPDQTRVAVLTHAEQADFNQVPGRFFYVLRLMAMELYFTHPEATRQFDLNQAPQPEGYAPPWG